MTTVPTKRIVSPRHCLCLLLLHKFLLLLGILLVHPKRLIVSKLPFAQSILDVLIRRQQLAT